ncbi:MAG: MFS transporter [Clostridia bacterium]|nr:MFS transporter [Clostridia bacterium]MBQ7907833.1 MFS transporter [Clostridia bacterium]
MQRVKYSNKMIVFLCTVAYFASYFSRKTFAVVMVEMLEKSVIDKTTGASIGVALFVFYGLGQLVSGVLGDKLPPKYLMFAGLMTSGVCNLLLPLVSPPLMVAVWAVNGFAQALLWPPIVRILSDKLSHEKYVTANLIVTCGAHVSTILLYVYAPICIRFMSWQAVFFSSMVFSIVVGIIFLIAMTLVLGKESIRKKEVSLERTESTPIIKTAVSTGIVPVFLAIVAMGFMRDGIESWLPTLYSEEFGVSAEESILVSVALPIFSIISLFLVRAIHKKPLFNNEITGSMVLFGISCGLCIILAVLININDPVIRMVCLILAALTSACMHSTNFLLISCLPGRYAKTGRAATVGGVCNACTYVGAAISMYGIAIVSERGWCATAVLWVAVCVMGIGFCLFALSKYTKFLKSNI